MSLNHDDGVLDMNPLGYPINQLLAAEARKKLCTQLWVMTTHKMKKPFLRITDAFKPDLMVFLTGIH